MQKIILLVIVISAIALALENPTLNLRVPSGLDPHQFYCDVLHRHKGLIKLNKGSIGIGEGANIGLGIRYRAWDNLDIDASYIRDNREYIIGASYAYFIPKALLRSQIDVQYFSYRNTNQLSGKSRNFFYALLLQTDRLFNHFTPTVNVGYDGYNQNIGTGFGGDIMFNFAMRPFESVNIIGEYFPVLDRDPNINGPQNSFALGVSLNTYRHQFILMAGNNTEIGSRRLMLGASNNDWHFGFTVTRYQTF